MAVTAARVGSVAVLVLAAAFFVVTTPTGHLPGLPAAARPVTGVTGATGATGQTGTSARPSGTALTAPTGPTPPLSTPPQTPTRPATPGTVGTAGLSRTPAAATSPGTPCTPSGLTIPALGVDTAVVRIGLQPDGTLGTPSDADKTKAGWYPSVLAGSAHGTVLMDGHTYHDDSAVFRMTFTQTARVGMDIRLSCAHRPVIAYRVSEMRLDLTPEAYPGFVQSRRLYSADGPPRLVLVTCTDWDARDSVWRHRGVLIATPLP